MSSSSSSSSSTDNIENKMNDFGALNDSLYGGEEDDEEMRAALADLGMADSSAAAAMFSLPVSLGGGNKKEKPKKEHLLEKLQKSYIICIDGIDTQIFIQRFSNRIFLLITQLGRMGTIIRAKMEMGADEGGMGEGVFDDGGEFTDRQREATFDYSILLGRRDDPMIPLIARRITEDLYRTKDVPKELLMSISLKTKLQAKKDGITNINEKGDSPSAITMDGVRTLINSILKEKNW